MGAPLDLYNKLINKCEGFGVCTTHLEAMREVLDSKDFNYLVISMFFGVADNGGFLHAHNSFYLDDDNQFKLVSEAFSEVGCMASIKTSIYIREFVRNKGVESAELIGEEDWAELEKTSDQLYGDSLSNMNICEDTLLEQYGNQLG